VTQPVHERTLDREDALLPARRRWRETPRLSEERVVETAEVDLDGWHLHVEILTQAAERHSRSSFWSTWHQAGDHTQQPRSLPRVIFPLLGSYCDRAASEPNDSRTTLKFGSRKG
jgi:hypothetical protein